MHIRLSLLSEQDFVIQLESQLKNHVGYSLLSKPRYLKARFFWKKKCQVTQQYTTEREDGGKPEQTHITRPEVMHDGGW